MYLCARGSPEPAADLGTGRCSECKCPSAAPMVVLGQLERRLGPHLREFEGIFLQKVIVWKVMLLVLQSSVGSNRRTEPFHPACLPSIPPKIMKCVIFYVLSTLQPESHS